MPTGLREQLAQLLKDDDGLPGAHLVIHGNPGDWSVAVQNAPDTTGPVWLATHREPSHIKAYKTLDGAWAAAYEVARLADQDWHRNPVYTIRVQTTG